VKPIWILLKQETVSGSGISWATCKPAPRCRLITTPAPHHSETQNKQKIIKPGLVAFYNIRLGNGARPFSKEKISKGGEGNSDQERTSGEAYNINKQAYIWCRNHKWNQGRIVLQSLHRAPLWLLLLLLQTVIMQTVSDELSKVELSNTELG